MKMNRIQFQPGLSMPEFFERYGSEAQCQSALQRRAGCTALFARSAAAVRREAASCVMGRPTGSAAHARTRPA